MADTKQRDFAATQNSSNGVPLIGKLRFKASISERKTSHVL